LQRELLFYDYIHLAAPHAKVTPNE